jgi:outer membrane lipoprotein-sorting protein
MPICVNISRKAVLKRMSCLLLLGLCAAGQPAPQRAVIFTKADAERLDRISDYLNSLGSLKGRFAQLGGQGQLDQGTFYLQKPGRLRFEYAPPSPVLVVSDGSTVAVANRKLGTVDRYPLSQTPFRLFLADKIDLKRSGVVLAVESEPASVTLRARTDRVRFRSDVRFVFSWPGVELRQWTVTDAQGLETTVSFSNLEPAANLDPALFSLPKPAQPAVKIRKN